MPRNKKKCLSAPVVFLVLPLITLAQAKSGVESYNQVVPGKEYTWMPVMHYQSVKGFYLETRYNYEAVKTFSVFSGKVFEKRRGSLTSGFTPMIGLSFGDFNGISAGLKLDLARGQVSFSSEMQYSISLSPGTASFYFNWSEALVDLSDHFFAGLALQFTGESGKALVQPGLVTGLSIGNFCLPVYFFNPFAGNRSLMVGLNYECQMSGRKKD